MQDYGLNTPLLQLTFMYIPLSFYLIYHFTMKGHYTPIAYWKLFLCALVDTHATVLSKLFFFGTIDLSELFVRLFLVIFAYTQTTLTSVMIIEDFAIPSAVILSIIILKAQYSNVHYVAIGLCIAGISCGFLNDFLIADIASKNSGVPSRPLLGDFLALCGAFLYALENVL